MDSQNIKKEALDFLENVSVLHGYTLDTPDILYLKNQAEAISTKYSIEIEKMYALINGLGEYIESEFGEEGIESAFEKMNLKNVDLAYSTDGNGLHDFQIKADFNKCFYIINIDGFDFIKGYPDPYQLYIQEIEGADFSAFISDAEEVLDEHSFIIKDFIDFGLIYMAKESNLYVFYDLSPNIETEDRFCIKDKDTDTTFGYLDYDSFKKHIIEKYKSIKLPSFGENLFVKEPKEESTKNETENTKE